jgi:hypothetical protein
MIWKYNGEVKFLARMEDNYYSDLAYRWAPIHYQYVNLGYIRRDMLCSVNYDGDWNTANNKDHIEYYELIPVVYYSIAETGTHYYILYSFYHADDLTHENDLEGCLLIVAKEDNLLGMISIAHYDFFSFTFDDRLQPGKETLDGELFVEEFNGRNHPITKQEANKHGLFAWGTTSWSLPWERDSFSRIGIRYYPANIAIAQNEFRVDSFNKTSFPYVLIDMLGSEGFWDKRDHKLNPATFSSWGTFNSTSRNSAHAPWVWDDINDDLFTGTIFFDPSTIAYRYFSGFDEFDTNYVKRMNGR